MSKTVRLPFVVQPRYKPIIEVIGTEESGKIEIERRGYLTVAEKQFVSSATSGDSSLSELHRIAALISRKEKKSQAEVMQDIIGLHNDQNLEYLEPYSTEISEGIMGMMAYQEKYKLIVACCLLMYRVDRKWGIAETMELHPDLVQALNDLYEDEDRKSISALENSESIQESEGVPGKQ